MLILVATNDEKLLRFELGEPVDPKPTAEERVAWVFERYDERRDALYDGGPSWATPVVLARLEEAEDEAEILRCLDALSLLRVFEASEPAAELLDHPSPAVRAAAIASVGRIGQDAERPRLEPFLEDADAEVQRAAVLAFAKVPESDAIARLERLAEARPDLAPIVADGRRRCDALERGDFAAYIEAALASDEYEDLLPMLGAIWELVCPILADRSRDLEIRRRALRLLTLMPIGKVRLELIQILDEPSEPEVLKDLAAAAAGRCRAHRALAPLIERARSADDAVRATAVTALGHLGNPDALDTLVALWPDADPDERARLRLAMARLARYDGALLADRWLRGEAGDLEAESLVAIDGVEAIGRELPDGVLRTHLADPDADVRQEALGLLAWLGGADSLEAVEARVGDESDDDLRRLAGLAVTRMRARLSSG